MSRLNTQANSVCRFPIRSRRQGSSIWSARSQHHCSLDLRPCRGGSPPMIDARAPRMFCVVSHFFDEQTNISHVLSKAGYGSTGLLNHKTFILRTDPSAMECISSALDGEAKRRACISSRETLSNSICSHGNLTMMCLRPSQPRPQHDGTCTGIHTMNNRTPIICIELTHHKNEHPKFPKFRAFQPTRG